MPILIVFRARPRASSTRPKKPYRRRHLFGSVELGLNDVDAAGSAVGERPPALEVVHGCQAGDHRVEKSLRYLLAVGGGDRVRLHMQPDVAHQQQASSRQLERFTLRVRVSAIPVEFAGKLPAALVESGFQGALHQAAPVSIHPHLVLGVYGRDRIFAVLDGGDGGLQQHVVDSRRVNAPDGLLAIELNLYVQAVIAQQNILELAARFVEAGELGRICEPAMAAVAQGRAQLAPAGTIHQLHARDIPVAPVGEAGAAIQKRDGGLYHARSAHRVEFCPALGPVCVRDGVGSVERIVETSPTRVGGIERVTCVIHRHHQLRSGHARDLPVHVRGARFECVAFRSHVADVEQELPVFGAIDVATLALPVPVIQLFLEGVAFLEKRRVFRPQVRDDAAQRLPKGRCIHAGARRNLVAHQLVQPFVDPEVPRLDVFTHHCSPAEAA